jgi:steroid 5-alpha reductase family enzyme
MSWEYTLLPLLIGLGFSCATMTVLWQRQRQTGNAGIVDVAWAAMVGLLGVAYALWPTGIPWLKGLAATMIAVWSLRLTWYLYRRVIGHPEEGRYRQLRESYGAAADQRFYIFYQAQALAAWAFALPVMVVCRSADPPEEWLVALAAFLWVVGVVGVYFADRQLQQFKARADHRGKTCRVGLWRYSRHPNYFFEWVHWCSYVPLSLGSGYWWISALVALVLLVSVLFVTGIPPTEAQAVASRGDDYLKYQQTTSAFVPWFPNTSGE